MAEGQKFDARLAEGVSYFEQMLEIMPEDRTTLEFLVVAYEQLGEPEKGQKALRDLAQLLIKERDIAALTGLIPRMEASEDPRVKAVLLKVKALTAPEPDLTPEAPKPQTEAERIGADVGRAIAAESALVAHLREEGVLAPELAESVVAQLEAIPADGRVFLVSALQILEKENGKACERAMAHLADRFGTPPIPLGSFDLQRNLAAEYPPELMQIRGAVPFARLGAVTLVAVLNPMDEELRSAFAAHGSCRFYLAEPSQVEERLGRLRNHEEAAQ